MTVDCKFQCVRHILHGERTFRKCSLINRRCDLLKVVDRENRAGVKVIRNNAVGDFAVEGIHKRIRRDGFRLHPVCVRYAGRRLRNDRGDHTFCHCLMLVGVFHGIGSMFFRRVTCDRASDGIHQLTFGFICRLAEDRSVRYLCRHDDAVNVCVFVHADNYTELYTRQVIYLCQCPHIVFVVEKFHRINVCKSFAAVSSLEKHNVFSALGSIYFIRKPSDML